MGSGDFGYWAERCGNPDAYCHANAYAYSDTYTHTYGNCHTDSSIDYQSVRLCCLSPVASLLLRRQVGLSRTIIHA